MFKANIDVLSGTELTEAPKTDVLNYNRDSQLICVYMSSGCVVRKLQLPIHVICN